ncbi:2-polyprenyl-6-methoxyphenol hydroxylase-like FAD-dependent oxidoreductase [Lipingzhangella halophila]|uniref:2-polyprenyl-6-methoxyphenol hydroxylase-like FAD-dependent oxidoreductase n=1 Tax=Lipingzhangella halophila TaxID=1783352 RepID=A0A7W7RDW1_9ACTN|nr:FAD-dependent monooxygenase [Lipingzhangella halophila]MBB4929843.1 2-polyprenyl-6-methoxyphenol hydroxylase-like FAD-dependent oxidoreductase [Lipingzhangella halophila]
MRIRHALVVGGGIGGLAAALALHRQGWTVTVAERAVSLAPVGSGIALAPNAVRALRELGVANEVRAWSADIDGMGVRHPDGRWLLHRDAARLWRRFGAPFIVMERANLVHILADRLPPDSVRLATRVYDVQVGDRGRPARVSTSRGELAADLVVAADGLRSAVRSQLFPGHQGPVHAGFTVWRAVVPGPEGEVHAAETWGQGGVVGVLPLGDGAVHCYASGVVPAGALFHDERAEALRRFGDWHAPIPELLAAGTPETLLRDDIFHLAQPLPVLHRGRVVLLGDAAHPMTPSLGQGGCQAIEDAVVLAYVVHDGADVPSMVHGYTAARLERTAAMIRRSARSGRLLHRESEVVVRARWTAAALLGRLPFDVVARQLSPVVDWEPPSLGEARGIRKR